MTIVTDLFKNANKVQLHYWFNDKSHTMDALIHNKCERELLELTKAIASVCGVSIKMETEPSARGGLKGWVTIIAKSEKKTPAVKIALVTTLVTASMVTPRHVSIGQVAGELIDRFMLGNDISEDAKEQFEQAINSLKAESAALIPMLDQSNLVKKRRSNFFDLLRKYQKIKKISLVLDDSSRRPLTAEQFVERDAFKNFILVSDHLPPQVQENALVEIVSPVLSKGKFKWKGIYNSSPISFSMKSDEFISLVQSGKVEFKSGTTINCTLEIERKINSEGNEKITNYNILHVNSYQEHGKPVETTEGKQQKQKQEVPKRQLDLFG
jgi:hypothetical protein